jgi:Peptidase family M50
MTAGWGQFERRTALVFVISLLVIGGVLAGLGSGVGLWLVIGMEISIVCHELGHALFAILGSMEVHTIMFGQGPLLWHGRFGETRVEWRVLPLSGHVTAHPALARRWYWHVLFILGGVFGNIAVIAFVARLDAVHAVSDAAGGGIVMAQALSIFVNLLPFSVTLNGRRLDTDGLQLLKMAWRRPFRPIGFRRFCNALLSSRRKRELPHVLRPENIVAETWKPQTPPTSRGTPPKKRRG